MEKKRISPPSGVEHQSIWIYKPYAIVFTVVCLFIIIFGIAIFQGYRQFNDTRNNFLTADKTTANLLADLILQHNRATIGVLQSYASRPRFIDAVQSRDLAGMDRRLSDLKKDANIDVTFVADKRSILLTNLPVFPESRGKDFSQRDWYRGISADWKPYISNVFKQIVGDKRLAVTLCVPIFDEKGSPIGILGNSQRLNYIDDTIEKVSFNPYTTVNVIDRVGKILYSNKISYLEKITDYRFFPIVEPALKGKKQQIEMSDPQKNQEKLYLTVVPIGEIGWTIIIERSLRDIYHSDLRRFIEIGAVSILLFLLITVFMVYLRKATLSRKTEELLKAEIKLRQEEKKLRDLSSRHEAILSAVPAIIMEVDNNKVYTWANSVGIEFFGEDVIGKEAAFYFEGDQDTYSTVRPLFNGTKDIIYVESWQRRRDGEKRLLAWWCRVLRDEKGDVEGALSSAYDITEHKRVEEALHVSEEKFAKAFQSSPDAFLLTSVPDGRITEVNAGAIRLSGYSVEEMFGRTTTELGLWADPAARDAYMAEILRDGQATNFETIFRVKSGAIITGLISGGIVQLRDGKCFLSVIRDISDRKQAEMEIHHLNAELEQRVMERTAQLSAANKELEAFSYSVSHDLRAPLRSIDGFSLALLEEYQEKLDDTGKTYLVRVRKATQRMGLLIDDMLKLSRISQAEIIHGAVDLSAIIRAIAEEHQKNNPDRAVDVIIQKGIMVQGDPYLMKIAVGNLVDNAFKFTGKESHPRIEFGTTVRDGETACFIRDNGAGFDMAYVDKLFGAFQRLHTKEEFAGTGIGLATVQRIIHRHGGQVWAEGEVGKGATFYFTIA